MPEFHSEPYLYLAGLTHKTALIAWGAFYFRIRKRDRDGRWKLVDDRDLRNVHPPRHESIGARSEPYGDAVVEVFDPDGNLAGAGATSTTNHVWITGLHPDTEYTYRVRVDGEEWAVGERRDWINDAGQQGLLESGRSYVNRFRTHPHPEIEAPVRFAIIGDFGTGVRKPSSATKRQREVAAALEKVAEEQDIRFIVTTGDNIYAAKTFLGIPYADTGDDDADWFFTYYQPYRYLLNRIPVYPTVGNHDTGETEQSDDRLQLLDNFFLKERLAAEVLAGRASLEPGLFYRFCCGADVELVCVDTSKRSIISGDRYFLHANHREFLESAFPENGGQRRWRIPFMHHPPYCAGPRHYNSRSLLDAMGPLFRRSGVRAVFSGHEHNFQQSRADGIDYFVTGAAGKIRREAPKRFAEAATVSWKAAAHFVLVDIDGDRMAVRPIGENGADLSRFGVDGSEITGPILISVLDTRS